MIPWLLIAEVVGRSGKSLSALVTERMQSFPSSGEINFKLEDPGAAIARIEAALAHKATSRDEIDGLTLAFDDWRLNLRRSNTEPLLRLNVEARGPRAGLDSRLSQVVALIGASPSDG